MKAIRRKTLVVTAALLSSLAFLSCKGKTTETVDHPRLSPNVVLRDVVFHSPALGREMQYRIAFPSSNATHQTFPVIYLLHGGGGSFRDWSNYSDVTSFAKTNVLVMPQGDYSYYVNSAQNPSDRYEDYIVQDLLSDVETRFPVLKGRANRAIVGVSMGGFGAIKIAFSHPELFVFAAGISPAIDVPRRPFNVKRIQQFRAHSAIFGPWGSESRRRNDPFLLARSVDPAKTPYIFISCGQSEGLAPPIHEFAALLSARHLRHQFQVLPGGHDWNQWNKQLPALFNSLFLCLARPA